MSSGEVCQVAVRLHGAIRIGIRGLPERWLGSTTVRVRAGDFWADSLYVAGEYGKKLDGKKYIGRQLGEGCLGRAIQFEPVPLQEHDKLATHIFDGNYDLSRRPFSSRKDSCKISSKP